MFSSLCTIVTPPPDVNLAGAPDPSVPYEDLTDHVDIPCIALPLSSGNKVQPTEVKSLMEVYSKNLIHVLLAGYFPLIQSNYRAVVDSIEYDIVGIESDSHHTQTRLAVQKVSL